MNSIPQVYKFRPNPGINMALHIRNKSCDDEIRRMEDIDNIFIRPAVRSLRHTRMLRSYVYNKFPALKVANTSNYTDHGIFIGHDLVQVDNHFKYFLDNVRDVKKLIKFIRYHKNDEKTVRILDDVWDIIDECPFVMRDMTYPGFTSYICLDTCIIYKYTPSYKSIGISKKFIESLLNNSQYSSLETILDKSLNKQIVDVAFELSTNLFKHYINKPVISVIGVERWNPITALSEDARVQFAKRVHVILNNVVGLYKGL